MNRAILSFILITSVCVLGFRFAAYQRGVQNRLVKKNIIFPIFARSKTASLGDETDDADSPKKKLGKRKKDDTNVDADPSKDNTNEPASSNAKKTRGRPKAKAPDSTMLPELEKKGTESFPSSWPMKSKISDSSLDLTSFLGDDFEIPEDLESLLPNLDDDLAKLEANLGGLDFNADLDLDLADGMFLGNSTLGDLEFEEALRDIESGRYDMSQLFLQDADADTDTDADTDVDDISAEGKLKLKMSGTLGVEDEDNADRDGEDGEEESDDVSGMTDLEDLIRASHDDADGDILDLVGGVDVEEEEEDDVDQLVPKLGRTRKLKQAADPFDSTARILSEPSVLSHLEPSGPVPDVPVPLSDELVISEPLSALDELILDKEFPLGGDPPPLEEFQRLMLALGGDSGTGLFSADADADLMRNTRTDDRGPAPFPPTVADGRKSEKRGSRSRDTSDRDEGMGILGIYGEAEADDSEEALRNFDVEEELTPLELAFGPQIYSGGDPNLRLTGLSAREKMVEMETETEIDSDLMDQRSVDLSKEACVVMEAGPLLTKEEAERMAEREERLWDPDQWFNLEDQDTEWRLQIVSVVTNSSRNSSALDIVDTIYEHLKKGTNHDPRIRYMKMVYAFKQQAFDELDNSLQMWCEGYNTYHLVDGAAMKEVWGCIMPHIVLSQKNLDAILQQVQWALEEDDMDSALLTPRMRRMRVRGGAQEMSQGYNTDHLDVEFATVSVR